MEDVILNGENMFLKKSKERRLRKRYAVNWDASVEAILPDFRGCIQVKVVNFSAKGALLHSDQVSINNQHLFVSAEKPDLNLKIFLPEMVMESVIEIMWYRWSKEKGLYEIGVEFMDFLEKNRDVAGSLLKFIEKDSAEDESGNSG